MFIMLFFDLAHKRTLYGNKLKVEEIWETIY